MSLKETLLNDMKEAMKSKDTIRKNTIQLVRSGVLQVEKDNRIELDDAGILEVVAKELKHRRDALPQYEKSGRSDLIEGLKKEIEILLDYLPKQLTENEISDLIEQTIAEVQAASMKDMGKLMAALSPKIKGRADTRLVSTLVKARLSK
ncbi:MAG: GatB/YqeY domain-containing protein [Lachnospiraceae bacterium]|nr:GatB/YqeY domain-containing protein [Lachnospiraceae bacterium]